MTSTAHTAETETQILDAVARFLDRDVRPYVLEFEHADRYPEAMVERMKELGLFGAVIPEDYGGLGLPVTTYAKIVEAVSAVRSEEHKSELQSLMRNSYAVFCLKKKKDRQTT